jgi:hypothetical protein
MDDGRPSAKDSHSDDGGLTEAIAPARSDNAQDAYRQVGKAHLELEGITNRPADGLRDRVRNEKVTEESTKSASRNTDPKQIQQEDLQPALAGPTSPIQTEMTGTMITGKMEKLNTRIATLSIHSSPQDTSLPPSGVGTQC